MSPASNFLTRTGEDPYPHGTGEAIILSLQATRHLAHLRHGVATAQRGWLTPDKVINTWPLGRLQEFLRKKWSAIPVR